MRSLLVVAAALVDPQGRVLVAQRPQGKSLAGLWEFPGGKVEAGETPEAALVRELAEELAITVDEATLQAIGFVSHAYPTFHLLMLLYGCRHWAGALLGQQGQALQWVATAELAALEMPPADVPLLPAIKAFVADR